MVSTRGTALLISSEQSVEQWMIECVGSMGFGYLSIHKPGEIEGIQDSLSLCLIDVTGPEGETWQEFLKRLRRHHPLLPGVLVSGDDSPFVPREALGAGIVDVLSVTEDLGALRPRLDRIARRVEAVRDIRSAIAALGSLTGEQGGQAGQAGQTNPTGEMPTRRAVLLVGSESSLGQSAEALQAAEIQVERAESFEQARLAVKENRFQVLVVDNDLPDAAGLEAMRDLAAASPDARILFVVGFTAADDAVQALRWGAASFLIKPIGAQQLLDQVQSLMQADPPQAQPQVMGEKAQEAVSLLEDAIARLCSH